MGGACGGAGGMLSLGAMALRNASFSARSLAISARDFRHAVKRVDMTPNQPAGTRNQLASMETSNFETRYKPMIQNTAVTMAAPVRFKDAIRASARRTP